MATLLVKNIGTLQTPLGSYAHKGKEQGENIKLHNAAILAEDGIIKAITSDGQLPCREDEADSVIDAEGNLVIIFPAGTVTAAEHGEQRFRVIRVTSDTAAD